MSALPLWLRRRSAQIAGTATGSALVLILLGTAASFAATAIPLERSATQNSALRARVDQGGAAAKTLLARGDYGNLLAALASASADMTPTPDDLALPQSALAARISALGLPVSADRNASWTELVSGEEPAYVDDGAPVPVQAPLRIAPVYRSNLSQIVSAVEGTLPDSDQFGTDTSSAPIGFDVAVTAATAERLHLSVHDKIAVPANGTDSTPALELTVTAIVRPSDPGSPYWTQDPLAATANRVISLSGPAYWEAEVFVGPDEAVDLATAMMHQNPSLYYGIGLDLRSVTADESPRLIAGLTAAVSTAQALPLPLPEAGGAQAPTVGLSLSAGPLPLLQEFVQQRQTVQSLLDLVLGSLSALGLVVLLLCVWLFTARRTEEFRLLRVRGASSRQLVGLAARVAMVGLAPCVLGFVLGVVVVPGAPSPASSWWLPAIASALALAGPALAVAGDGALLVYRRGRRGAGVRSGEPVRRSRFRAARGVHRPAARVVGYSTLVLLCVGGLATLRAYGDTAAGPLAIVAPFLLAVVLAAAIRFLTPVAMRAVSRVATARGGTVSFVAAARAARGIPAALAPSFILVLALAVVALASMSRATITAAENSASWAQTGADVRITAPDNGFSNAAVDALEHVDGTSRAVAARVLYTGAFTLASDQWAAPQDTVLLIVDPARYRDLTATTPVTQMPDIPSAAAGRSGTVLASAPVATGLAGTPTLAMYGKSIPVTVGAAGTSTAALPGTADFVIVPENVVPAAALALVPVNTILIDGPVDQTKLAETVRARAPGSSVVLRSAALATLAASPFQSGTKELAEAALFAALALALVGVLAGAALTARARETTLAHLATLGLTERQGLMLVWLEALPGLVAAIVGGVACTVLTSLIVGSSIDLSVFTGSNQPVALRAAPGALVVAAGAIAVTALLAHSVDAMAARRRGVTAALRVGEQ
ncbi:hypothetical protein [Actinospica robiniae]|uniref:hypothetical protein n=1 Tax=Actinospica robiniae TaxID=304901 RepID=UPI000403B742|nr:hypothetical protein [Actinospica robiniae]